MGIFTVPSNVGRCTLDILIVIIVHLGAPAGVALDLDVCRDEVHVEGIVAVLILEGGGEDLVPDAGVGAALGGHGVAHVHVVPATRLVHVLVGLVVGVTVRAEYHGGH